MLRVFWRMAAAVAGNWLSCRPLADKLLPHSVPLGASKKLLRLALKFRFVVGEESVKMLHAVKMLHVIYLFSCYMLVRSMWYLQVVGKGVLGSVGIVMSINEQEGIATVKFPSCEYRRACKASDILTVPISRLCTPRSEVQALYATQSLFLWKISV